MIQKTGNLAGIKSWPAGEAPRDRLIENGAEALSDAQLLAIIIRVGSRGNSAVDLSNKILQAYRSLNGLAQASVEELCHIGGIGRSKAAQILASIEIGKRALSNKRDARGKFLSSRDLFNYFGPELSTRNVELFKIVLLDTKNRLIRDVEVSRGSLNLAIVHPREVFKMAIRESSAALILIHNHPSGDPEPSPEDVDLTEKLVRAGHLLGIPVMDHLIIGQNAYFSFADHHLIERFDRTR
jgi:DNA repair protein RadC